MVSWGAPLNVQSIKGPINTPTATRAGQAAHGPRRTRVLSSRVLPAQSHRPIARNFTGEEIGRDQIGFAERKDYTAIGTVTNLAARLCAEAKDGQILVSHRVAIAVDDSATLEEIGDLALKGLSQAVAVYNVPQ